MKIYGHFYLFINLVGDIVNILVGFFFLFFFFFFFCGGDIVPIESLGGGDYYLFHCVFGLNCGSWGGGGDYYLFHCVLWSKLWFVKPLMTS
jgi:hypothetical protein